MKSIAFVIPYFGKLPDYLPVWLASCAANPTIDFYLFTDDRTQYSYPQNVKVIYKSFEEIKELLQNQFDFPIALPNAYKLCDYRPVFGIAFSEWIGKYDFWGHCDLDLIWGNIRNYFTEDKLLKYDRVLWLGHCSIYRNCERMNQAYKILDPKGCMNWREVYSSERLMAFDEYAEHNGGGISLIMEKNDIPIYRKWVFADLCVGLKRFQCSYTENSFYTTDDDSYSSFFWRDENGLYFIYRKSGEIRSKEMMYVHCQKRPLKIKCQFQYDGKDTYLLLPPGKVVDTVSPLSKRHQKKILNSNHIYYLASELIDGLAITKLNKRIKRKIERNIKP